MDFFSRGENLSVKESLKTPLSRLPVNVNLIEDAQSQSSYFDKAHYSKWKSWIVSSVKVALPVIFSIGTIAITEILKIGNAWQVMNYAAAGAMLSLGMYASPIAKKRIFLAIDLNMEILLWPTLAYDNGPMPVEKASLRLIEFAFGAQVMGFLIKFITSTRENDPMDGVDLDKKIDGQYIEMLWYNGPRSYIAGSLIACAIGMGAMYGSKCAKEPFFQRLSEKAGYLLLASAGGRAATIALVFGTSRAEKRVLIGLGQDSFSSRDQLTCLIKILRISKILFWIFGEFLFGLIAFNHRVTDVICGFNSGIIAVMQGLRYTHTDLLGNYGTEAEVSRLAPRTRTWMKIAHGFEGLAVLGFLGWQAKEIKLLWSRVALGAFGTSVVGSILIASWIKVPRRGSLTSKINATAHYYFIFLSPNFIFYNAILQEVKVGSNELMHKPWLEMAFALSIYASLGAICGRVVYLRIKPEKLAVFPSYKSPTEGKGFFSQFLFTVIKDITGSLGQ